MKPELGVATLSALAKAVATPAHVLTDASANASASVLNGPTASPSGKQPRCILITSDIWTNRGHSLKNPSWVPAGRLSALAVAHHALRLIA
jgi:hypothetical protein